MPTPTYTPLANITLTGSAATLTFSSISGLYRDLVLVADMGATSTNTLYCRVNGDTGSNYNYVIAKGNGSSTSSYGYSSQSAIGISGYENGVTNTTRSMLRLSILDYSATDKHKSLLIRLDNAATADVGTWMNASRWASTSAVTSFVIYPGSGSFTSGSTFALYGVAAC